MRPPAQNASFTLEATLHEVVTALRGEPEKGKSCAVCRLQSRSVERAIRSLFAEFVNDPQTRQRFRQARGFCAVHTPLLAEYGDALGVAILYHDLIEQTRERWQAESKGALRVGKWGKKKPEAAEPCPACRAAQEAEARYIGAIAAGLENADLWSALEAGGELCLTHAEQILAQAKAAPADLLRHLLLTRLDMLQAELAEIIRKNDYRFRGEPWGAEKDAWLRALGLLNRPK